MMDDKNKSIGAAIKAARRAKGLSQEEFARSLGYDNGQFVSDWERGQSPIPMKKLAEISRILNMDRDQLFELLLQFSVDRLSDNMRKEYSQQRLSKARSRT
jgi:transcriptional regulator with XRE-family HTH domain